jgi:hypothetical protein
VKGDVWAGYSGEEIRSDIYDHVHVYKSGIREHHLQILLHASASSCIYAEG